MFEFFGINFYWYGFLIGLGVWLAIEIALAGRGAIKKNVIEKAVLWAVLGGVIGARVYHVVDYWNTFYSSNLVNILYFWEGGLGIWGAISGGLIGLLLFCYLKKQKFVELSDVLVVGIPLAQMIGRIGNYINGELVGKNGEPLFAYEGFLNLILFFVLWKISRKNTKKGFVSGVYLVGYGVIRILLENLRPNETIWKFQDIPVAIIFSLLAIFLGSYFIFWKKQS